MNIPETATIAEARDILSEHIGDGTTCPVCDQFAKVYRRKLNSSMVRGLIAIFHWWLANDIDEWVHIPTLFLAKRVCASNDGALLRHWGLIEAAQGVRADGSDRIGYYRITEAGVSFVLGECSVPKYAILYNNVLLRLEEPQITVLDALGSRFNYAELMNGV